MNSVHLQDRELEAKIEAARIKFEEAKGIYDKQLPIVPLSAENIPTPQTFEKLKEITDNYNRSHDEYISLLEQRRDEKFSK